MIVVVSIIKGLAGLPGVTNLMTFPTRRTRTLSHGVGGCGIIRPHQEKKDLNVLLHFSKKASQSRRGVEPHRPMNAGLSGCPGEFLLPTLASLVGPAVAGKPHPPD